MGEPWTEKHVRLYIPLLEARKVTKPLVSILIPAYNAGEWLADTLRSAIAQTWERKEIIVVDDGSSDETLPIARQFEADSVRVFTQKNQGAAAARNQALLLSKGDYIQWLDADDLLAPEKIERQLAALREIDSKWILLSSAWASFNYRTQRASFIPTSLWQDLSPVEWLLRKLGNNLHMQTATWLTSRELAEAAGPWDTRLLSDDDGEYFCRVLLASEGTRFVPQSKVFYRITQSGRLSHIGASDRKKDAMLVGMKLHIRYLRSLEDSERVRKACMAYLQNWYFNFYPERPELVAELQSMAAQLHGHLVEPRFSWKYAWMKPVFGWKAAKWAQAALPQFKASCIRHCDKAIYRLQGEPSSRPVRSTVTHKVANGYDRVSRGLGKRGSRSHKGIFTRSVNE
jgi:glycosyltransferase involved in cell wall biosynthesis